MIIAFDKRENMLALIINDTIYGHYPTAVAAAADVYCHSTGCYDWDKLDGTIFNVPAEIFYWEWK